jgi:hypothetical protein
MYLRKAEQIQQQTLPNPVAVNPDQNMKNVHSSVHTLKDK